MNSNIKKVFISYTLRDENVTIKKLQALKRQMPLSCDSFVDIIDNDSEDRQARVDKELWECNSFMQVRSPSIGKSDWALYETMRAWTRMIPVNVMWRQRRLFCF